MPDDTPTTRAVLRRMAELGIGRFNQDLAEASGVGEVAIGKLLNESTDRPQGRTLKAIADALRWPTDWLDYIRRGEPIPETRASAVGSTSVDYRSGEVPATASEVQAGYEDMFDVGTKLVNMARDTGVISTVGSRNGRVDANLIVGGETVGVLEVKMWRDERPVPPDLMTQWSDQLQARMLRMTVAHDRDIAVVGWFAGPHAEDALESYDEQLQWALEQVAKT